ncbi:MAG: aminoglycoside phosphotransferase family protein [Bacteroidales bacterium]|nr:aminoglycoside phosphotransferase family protein [Bacteroidales bacterium]
MEETSTNNPVRAGSETATTQKLLELVRRFRIEGMPLKVTPIISGHINDSYLVSTIVRAGLEPAPTEYLLQRINHGIFRDIPGLMNNIGIVTGHISQRIQADPAAFGEMRALELVPTVEGDPFYTDPQGNFWRVYHYIPGSLSYDRVPGTDLAYEGGKAFGKFQVLSAGIDPGTLTITIPRFHDITWRLEQFEDALHSDLMHRVAHVPDEIHCIRERAQEMHTINQLIESSLLPTRVTHNDTKFNNILFNQKNTAICIVDLDTVMPGTVLYDFGDAIRTGTNTADEDESNLEKVSLDMGLFEAYSRGFLETAGTSLTQIELDHLAFSARFMTYIIGLRFLTDYLNGDTYYMIHRTGHNLQRARCQFKLLSEMEKQTEIMERIIETSVA